MVMKQELIDLLIQKSVQYRDEPAFKLVSGRTSRFYVNCKPTILSPRGMYLVGHLVFDAVKELAPQGVGGLTFGADPIAMATAFVSELEKAPFHAFSIRKEQKDHGMVKWIEGDLPPGARVVILEDVVTTGGSTLKAVDRARSEGLDIARVVTLVDRQEGGLDAIRKSVPDTQALIGRDELVDRIKSAG